jgi:DNA-binding NarL/FixJ family response regulator
VTELQRHTVVLADDHAMVRQALAQILEDSREIRVVGQASDGASAIEVVEQTRPELVVLDFSMPGMHASSTIQQLLKRQPKLKILVLTVHEKIHYAVRVLEEGAHGYVVKSAAAHELLDAIRAVSQGEIYISPKVSHKVIHALRRPKRDRAGLEALSQREFDLLRLLGAGYSLSDCAAELDISISAASTYRARLLEKLNLKTTPEIIRFALENGIVG